MENVSDDWIEKAALKDRLEEIVNLRNQELGLKKLGRGAELIPIGNGIHVYEGIDSMADSVGLGLSEEVLERPRYQFEYSFVYKGIRFFQLEEERMAGYEDV